MRRQSLAWSEVGGEPEPAFNSGVTARALAYLTWESTRPVAASDTAQTLGSRARGLYVLSLYGAIKAEVVHPMLAYAADNTGDARLSRAGQAWLALALWQTGDNGDALALINRLMPAQAQTMQDDEAAAPLLEGLVSAGYMGRQGGPAAPDSTGYRDAAEEYVSVLMQMREGPLWSRASLSADAIWALSRYAGQETNRSAGVPTVVLNDHLVQETASTGNPGTLSVVLPGSALHAGTNSLKLQAPEGQVLYYSLTLRASR